MPFAATIDFGDERGKCTATGVPISGHGYGGVCSTRIEDIEAVDEHGEPIELTADEESKAEDAILKALLNYRE